MQSNYVSHVYLFEDIINYHDLTEEMVVTKRINIYRWSSTYSCAFVQSYNCLGKCDL